MLLLNFTYTAVSPMSDKKDYIFQSEFMPHVDALFNFARNLAGNENDANDLVQETYMNAYQSIGSYKAGSNPKAWLFRILKNNFINEYRKKSRRPKSVDYTSDSMTEEELYSHHNSYLDMSKDIYQNMLGDEVTIAINALPIDLKTVILLRDIEGFSYDEIAKILDVPVGTIRSRLHRGRNLLKSKLWVYAKDMGFQNGKGRGRK